MSKNISVFEKEENINFSVDSRFHIIDDATSGNNLDNQFDIFNSVNEEKLLVYIRNNSFNNSIKCYNLDNNQEVYLINNITKSKIKCIKHYILDNRDIFVISSYDNKIKFYDLYKAESIFEINNAFDKKKKKYKDFWINSFCLFVKEKNIFLVSQEFYENNLKIWQIKRKNKSYEIENTIKVNDIKNLFYLDIYSYYNNIENKNFDLIITCGYKINIKFINFETKTIYKEYNTRKKDCRSVKIGGINKKYVICNHLEGLFFFDFITTQLINFFDFSSISISSIIYNDKFFIYSINNKIQIIDLNTFKQFKLKNDDKIKEIMKKNKITDIKILKLENNKKLICLHNYPYIIILNLLFDM